MARKRRTFSAKYKAEVALEALKEEKSISEIAADRNINPSLVRRWRDDLVGNAEMAFADAKREREEKQKELVLEKQRDEALRALGTASLERDWLRRVYEKVNGCEPPDVGED